MTDGERRQMSDTEHDEIVYIPAEGNGNGSQVAHTDRSCSRLQNARKVHDYPRDSLPNRRICKYCRGEVLVAGGNNSGPWQDLQAADPDDLVTDDCRSVETDSGQEGGSR